MAKVLVILFLLGFASFFIFRSAPSSIDGDPVVTVGDQGGVQNAGASSSPQAGGSRFRELMNKATGGAGAGATSEEGLRAFVSRVDPSRLSFRELDELFESLENDPEAGLILMDRVLSDPDRDWTFVQKETLLRRSGVLAAVADFGSLESRLSDLEAFEDRSLFVQGAAEGLAGQEIEKSLLWIDSLAESALQTPALRGVGKAWGKEDLTLATEWAEGLSDPSEKAAALEGLVAGWALTDATSAFDYARNAPNELGDRLIVEAAGSVALKDPKLASEQIVAAAVSPKQKAVLEESVAGWAEDDFEGVAAWSMLVANTDMRDTAMVSLADHWSKDDPKKATEWAESFPTADARARMLAKTLPHWAQTNPSESAEWFQDRPVDIPQISLLKKTVESFGVDDPLAAEAWINQIDSPALKQIGLNTLQSLPAD